MADLAKLVDELSALTVMEAADLSKMLEEKWGVSAAAAVAVAAGGAAAGAAAEEKTEFDVILAERQLKKVLRRLKQKKSKLSLKPQVLKLN